jgi:hypothetical protein
MQNLHHSKGRAGYRGVEFHGGRYVAKATIKGRKVYLGRHDTAEQAHEAASQWRRKHMPFSAQDRTA